MLKFDTLIDFYFLKILLLWRLDPFTANLGQILPGLISSLIQWQIGSEVLKDFCWTKCD